MKTNITDNAHNTRTRSTIRKAGNTLKNTLARYAVATIGLAFVAMGTALSIKSDLGTAPVSAPPYVAELCGGLTVGQYTSLLHCLFIILQIILLRKQFKASDLMQIPAALVFGYMIDFFVWTIASFTVEAYLPKLLLTFAALFCTALGVSIEVRAGAWMLAGEMMVRAISQVSGRKFRNVKIVFDTSLVLLSAGVAWLIFGTPLGDGTRTVIREGTLIAALFTGWLMRFIDPVVDSLLRRL